MEGIRTRSQARRADAANAVQRAQQESACDSLPEEIVADILHRVAKTDFTDLLRAQQVCRLWRSVSYTVPDIRWSISSKQTGSALVHFLKERPPLGAPINSVRIRLAKQGLVEVAFAPVVAALTASTAQSCHFVGPDPLGPNYVKWDEGEAEALAKGTVEFFNCIPALRSVEVLRLVDFRATCIRDPLPLGLLSLKVLILRYCYLKKVLVEQLINLSPNLKEARWECGQYEEEERSESPSLLHIVSKSLAVLRVDQNNDMCGADAHLVVDAPSLTSLRVDYDEYCATLKTPKLVELTMSCVDHISTAPLQHLVKLTLQGYCYTFEHQVPNILHCTPRLTKLCIVSHCARIRESELLDLDALLPELPGTLEHLVLGWDFLRGLRMRQASSAVNESVVELVISEYYEVNGQSEIRSLKRRLRLLRKAFLSLQKVALAHLCPSRFKYEQVRSIIDIFDGVDCVQVRDDS